MLGFLAGAVVFGLTYEKVFIPINKIANFGSQTMGDMLNVNSWLVISFFLLASITMFYALEKNNM